MIRNPYKAIISYWNFAMTGSHVKITNAKIKNTEKFNEFARVGIERWLEVIQDWIDYSNKLYIVYYEVLFFNHICPF